MLGKTISHYKVLEKIGEGSMVSRRRFPPVKCLVISCLLLLCCFHSQGQAQAGTGTASAQDEGTPRRRAVRLDLGFAQSPPGSHVSIPITLTLPRGVEIGSAINEITFPAQLLSFQEVRKGLAAEMVEAEVTTEVKQDDQDRERSILKVTIRSKTGMAIPRGVLIDLVFNVSEQAQLGETLVLKNAASAVNLEDPPQPIDPITGDDGEVAIDEAAIAFACFFYMH